jgi:hypothetical protein
LRKSSDPEKQEFDDNIRPEDGLERHWLFFNGETYRLYAFIVCLLFLVCLGILYLLGKSDGPFGIAAGIFAGLSFLAGLGIHDRIDQYQTRGWRKDWRTPRIEQVERRVALYLWLFIFISVGGIILLQWARGRWP